MKNPLVPAEPTKEEIDRIVDLMMGPNHMATKAAQSPAPKAKTEIDEQCDQIVKILLK